MDCSCTSCFDAWQSPETDRQHRCPYFRQRQVVRDAPRRSVVDRIRLLHRCACCQALAQRDHPGLVAWSLHGCPQ
jgi:hypothetical protein